MSVYRNEKPKGNKLVYRWKEEDKLFDIWYDRIVPIRSACDEGLPAPLAAFLDDWNVRIKEYMTSFRERYPVKMAKIEFIYEDTAYAIYPKTVGATYESTFMSDTPYEVSWDSLFEEYEKQIREELASRLGITHSRYSGYLD